MHAGVACRGWRREAVSAGFLCVARAALVSVVLVGGCAPLTGVQNEFDYSHDMYQLTTQLENSLRAYQAWERRETQFCDEPHLWDFAAGFRQGYYDVASGEDGCPPPLPPRTYWASCFETVKGQRRIEAWFAGHRSGADAAMEEAAGVFRPILASAEIRHQRALPCAEPVSASEPAPEPAPVPAPESAAGKIPESVPAGPAEPDAQQGSGPSLETPPPNPADESPLPPSVTAAPGRQIAETETASIPESQSPVQAWTPAELYRR
jgi:hypothetical protein